MFLQKKVSSSLIISDLNLRIPNGECFSHTDLGVHEDVLKASSDFQRAVEAGYIVILPSEILRTQLGEIERQLHKLSDTGEIAKQDRGRLIVEPDLDDLILASVDNISHELSTDLDEIPSTSSDLVANSSEDKSTDLFTDEDWIRLFDRSVDLTIAFLADVREALGEIRFIALSSTLLQVETSRRNRKQVREFLTPKEDKHGES